MSHPFDAGYPARFRELCKAYPGTEVGAANWAKRSGATPNAKRVTITVTVPKAFRP